MDVGKRS